MRTISTIITTLALTGCTVTTPVWSLSVDPTAATEVGRQAAEVARDVLSDK
tara:strand:- start:2939 stop:3091 length:153 start_codon:yes stop_codon:yes gene_type:complete